MKGATVVPDGHADGNGAYMATSVVSNPERKGYFGGRDYSDQPPQELQSINRPQELHSNTTPIHEIGPGR